MNLHSYAELIRHRHADLLAAAENARISKALPQQGRQPRLPPGHAESALSVRPTFRYRLWTGMRRVLTQGLCLPLHRRAERRTRVQWEAQALRQDPAHP